MSATAPAVDQVMLVGNLTADPVLKQFEDDRKVCQLRLAVNDQKDKPMFIDVATFGAQAEACARRDPCRRDSDAGARRGARKPFRPAVSA